MPDAPLDTATRILNSAEQLIQQRGYNGFSYDDVAKSVGIRKPSIHHHFATKAALGAAVAQRYADRFDIALREIETAESDPHRRLTAYAALFERTFATDRRLCLCGMLGAEAPSLPASVSTEVDRFFERNLVWLRARFSEGQRAGAFQSALRPAALADSFLCSLEGAMVIGRTRSTPATPAQVARTFLRAITPG